MERQAQGQERWEIDTAHSQLGFSLRHIVVSEIHGQFGSWGGEMIFDPDQVRAAGPDRESVRAAIAATKDFQGVIGTTSFDANGDTTNKWISIYEVKNGAWTYVDQIQFK